MLKSKRKGHQQMPTVILINPIAIPGGEEKQFLPVWLEAAEYMRHAPGFRSLRLHKSLDPQAKFRFVNVAEWESAQQWQEAASTQPARITEEIQKRWPDSGYPALYYALFSWTSLPSLRAVVQG
jgi:heme-degrading monooxygenase HmoA